MFAALFVCRRCCSQGAQVVWGTLLQMRVPPAMLGRVSSLDFFVSLALMPISMAVAGPVGEAIGIAAGVPHRRACCRHCSPSRRSRSRGFGDDELAHPLDAHPDPTIVTGAEAAAGFEMPVDEAHPQAERSGRVDPEPG